MSKRTQRTPAGKRKVDPVTVEIMRNGVIAVTEEMKTNLMRTAYNMIIYEALDFTTGLFTPAGETVSIGIGLPTFIRGMAETVKAKIRHFGIKSMKPGDIYVTNDSYTTGSHLNHFHSADLSQGQTRRLFLLHGALARRRRHARRHDHGHTKRLTNTGAWLSVTISVSGCDSRTSGLNEDDWLHFAGKENARAGRQSEHSQKLV